MGREYGILSTRAELWADVTQNRSLLNKGERVWETVSRGPS